MTFDFALLLLAILSGAALQIGVGLGFSIVVAPVMMVLLGTASAVPVLLMLNTLVSVMGTERQTWRQEHALVRRAIVGCLMGILIGLLIYPYLSEQIVLFLTAVLLLFGFVSSFLSLGSARSSATFDSVSGLSGLATIWAATPGPLLMFGLLRLGRKPQEARKLVQPVALVAYGVAFALHLLSDMTVFLQIPWLWQMSATTVCGCLLGRFLAPLLPQGAITQLIRAISFLACVVLLRRAFLIG